MRRALLLSGWVLLGAGCLHAREVDDKENAKEDGEAKAEEKAEPKKAPVAVKPKPKPAEYEEGRPHLSNSPTGIMQEDGVLKVQQALVKRGYLDSKNRNGVLDDATSAALRKFQGDEEVARTGAPDRETVRKLGLSVEDVFRTARSSAP